MPKTNDLQMQFLCKARQDKLNVTFFLMNGYQLRGQITAFDAFVVFLCVEGRQMMIYKHAISTIAPERPVLLDGAD